MILGILIGIVSSMAFSLEAGVAAPGVAQDTSYLLSCAAFPADLTEADLVRRFGAANVVRDSVFGYDDGPQDATVVFPDDSARRLEIFWQDNATRSRPRWISAQAEEGRWRSRQGITLGMSVRTLERMNGRPFALNGFHQELSGLVRSWGGGRLELPATDGCELRIRLRPPKNPPPPRAHFRQLLGRIEYSSAHSAMQAVNPAVISIDLRYERR